MNNRIQWERDLVERPFCQQLQNIGWQWLEGDTEVSEFTERDSFREVLLKGRLAAAFRTLNRREGQPWLDDARIAPRHPRFGASRRPSLDGSGPGDHGTPAQGHR